MQIIFYLLLTFLMFSEVFAIEHKIEISIDDNPITTTDIRDRSKLMILSSGLPNIQKSYDMLHDKVLEILIDERLIKKEADRLNIKIDASEIVSAIHMLAARNNMKPDQLVNFFKSQNISESEMNKQLWHQLVWSKIIASAIQANIVVSDDEINENRIGIERRNNQILKTVELKLAEIVLFDDNEQNIEKNKLFAQKLYHQIKAGANFGNLAREFSQTPSANSDGVIGWISSNQIPLDLSIKLASLNKNDVYLAYLPDGVHIFKLLDRKTPATFKKKITNEQIRQFLEERKLEVGIKTYLKKIRTNSHIQKYIR